ncbi:MAG: hypothetical protein JWQ09_1142 [Segetibacter sp.]|nr:hypothetical protein [Segetibacter sp.]
MSYYNVYVKTGSKAKKKANGVLTLLANSVPDAFERAVSCGFTRCQIVDAEKVC